jgi:hypothetical protein
MISSMGRRLREPKRRKEGPSCRDTVIGPKTSGVARDPRALAVAVVITIASCRARLVCSALCARLIWRKSSEDSSSMVAAPVTKIAMATTTSRRVKPCSV